MKVLAIQGSPHKGNTYARVERFGSVLTSLGGVDFEHVPLKDMNIQPCRGCFLCFYKGVDTCPLEDDKADLARRLDEADGVVFATPVYSMHVSYLLKTFMDRFAYNFHRPRYFGKYAVGLAVAGVTGLNETLDYIKMVSSSWGYEYLGDMRYIDTPTVMAVEGFVDVKDKTEDVTRRLHRAITTRPPRSLTMKDYMHFHMMRAAYSRMEAVAPVDYAYWKDKGWLDPGVNYFMSHVKGSVLKSLAPRFIAWVVGRSIDKKLARPGSSRPQD
jgi:multimeric flavodoxin WrbA